MKHLRRLIVCALTLLASVGIKAQTTFTAVNADGVTITYLVLDEDAKTCQTGIGTDASSNNSMKCTTADPTILNIPATVTNSETGTTYKVVRIGNYSFYGKSPLIVNIPEGVTEIGGGAFWSCGAAAKFNFPSTLKKTGSGAFRNSKIEELIFPEGMTTFGGYTCTATPLKRLYIPSTITTWGSYEFAYDTELEEITFGAGLTTIAANAFNLTAATATPLKRLVFPASIVSIGANAFGNHTSINEVVSLNTTPPSLDTKAFYTGVYSQASLTVPTGSKQAYADANVWKTFSGITEADIVAPAIPDATLRSYIYSNWDTDGNGYFTQTELEAPTTLSLNYTGGAKIADLTGLEAFPNIATVEVNGHSIYAADLSECDVISTFSATGQSGTLDPVNMSGGRFGVPVPAMASTAAISDFKVNGTTAEPAIVQQGGVTYLTFPATATGDYVITYNYNPGLPSLAGTTFDVTINTSITDLSYYINEQNFPDAVWRNYISTTYDTDSDGKLSETELAAIAAVKTLGTVGVAALTASNAIAPFTYVAYKNETTRIHNMKGIELFTGLEQLNLRGNNIETLDLSNNKQLRIINLHFNQLLTSVKLPEVEHTAACSLYVGACFKLEELDLRPLSNKNNKVSLGTGGAVAAALTFTAAPSTSTNQKVLRKLVLPANIGNQQLVLSYMLKLEELDASAVTTSTVTTLTMNSCSALTEIDTDKWGTAFRNKLTTININPTAALKTLKVKNCSALTNLNQSGSAVLSNIELEALPKLSVLTLQGNTGSDFPKVLDISHLTTLKTANLYNNYVLEEIITTGLTALTTLSAYGNTTTRRNLKKVTGLETNTALTSLSLYGNQIDEIDVSTLTKLSTNLFLHYNNLQAVDVSKNTALKQLNVSGNKIKSLDLTNNNALTHLYVYDTDIDTLDLSGKTALTQLTAYNTKLKTLDLSECTSLGNLLVYNSALEKIILSSATVSMGQIKVQNNALLALDLTGKDFTGYNTAANDQYILSPQSTTREVVSVNGKAGLLMPYAVPAEYITDLTIDGNEATATMETVGDDTYLILAPTFNAADWKGDDKGVVKYKMNPNVTCTKEDGGTAASAGVKAERMEVTVITTAEEAEVTPVDVFISPLGQAEDGKYYASLYYGTTALTVPSGVTAYTYTASGRDLTVSRTYATGDVIPAGQGVILMAEGSATFSFEPATTAGTPDANSMLFGSDEQQTFDESGYVYYMLSTPPADSPYGIGFWWQTDGGRSIVNGAHKAYLKVPEAQAADIKGFNFGGSTTGIQPPTSSPEGESGAAWFTLDGQKLNAAPTQKGVYLKNGKKVVIK